MASHDIIDNRTRKLVDDINRMLSSTDSARFAVGYFFLSGLIPIASKLTKVKELKLLIGNTTNRETLEQIAEGYKRLELVSEQAEEEFYPKRTESRRMRDETGENLKEAVELMDQTDQGEQLINSLVKMIQEKRLKVKVYTRGRLHAKAYIFDYGHVYDQDGNKLERHETGIGIVGSSNLSISGITHNTELNVVVQGNDNHAELVRWFDELWDESEKFDATLIEEMEQSWAMAQVRPYDIYMKTLYNLVKDRLEDGEESEILWDDEITRKLAEFQKVAVRQGVQTILQFGGVFISDVVGMGKSYIGAAIIKHFERTRHARPLIICPATLTEMWECYNEVYQLNARVVSMGLLREGEDNSNPLKDDIKYSDRDFVLIDESHNFRHSNTQRYKLLESFLGSGQPCCLLTATPRNKSSWDIYHQTKLFHQDERTDIPIDPPILREYFRGVENGRSKIQNLLVNILIRRTRNHILRWYGYDSKTHKPVDPSDFDDYLSGKKKAYIIVGGKHQFFPIRELRTVQYSIEKAYQGLYQEIRKYLGKPHHKSLQVNPPKDMLTYARYGLWHYVKTEKKKGEPYTSLHRAGVNLRGLIRMLLFKRFESSVYAFQETIKRLITIHKSFLTALDEDIVPAGEDAQQLLYESDQMDETDLIDALRKVTGKYSLADFNEELLRKHIAQDLEVLNRIQELVAPITSDKDDKLLTLKGLINKPPLKGAKKLIFTQYADTARYLYQNLNPGEKRDDIDVIYSGEKSKASVVGRFAPKANPELKLKKGDTELQELVATDVLAEGLNLQDCDNIINYDLHWNPVRLIQRFGRIDRIGSSHEVIYGFNFLPEFELEKQLGIKQVLHNRIQEIHDTIGEDSVILDDTERLNESAMYAIYEQKGGQLNLFEEEEDLIDLNEAEEILRQLQQENPEEYERIASLRDGIRTGKPSREKGTYVFCQAGQYKQLFLINPNGEIVSRDIPQIVSQIKCSSDSPAEKLPKGHNESVMRVKGIFSEEVKHRQAEKDHRLSLTVSQRYVLREMKNLYDLSEDEDEKSRINLLEKSFRGTITTAVNRELNLLRRNGVTGDNLLKNLRDIYLQHNIKDWVNNKALSKGNHEIPQIICSESLL